MIQLLLHGLGDYILQTDYQALNKKKKGRAGFFACLMHCTTYSIPFLLIGSFPAVLAIFITHFAIDRTNFIAYLIAIKNGTRYNNSQVMREGQPDEFKIYDPQNGRYDISNFGYSPERPFAITIWLYIIVDNLFHITCNYFALMLL